MRAWPSTIPASDAPATDAPPTPGDLAWTTAIAGVKAVVVALAVDAFLNADAPRYQGKGMRLRAIGYAGGAARRTRRVARPGPARARTRASSTWR